MSKIAQIYYYDPQSAGINLHSPQSDSTPWTLTLGFLIEFTCIYHALACEPIGSHPGCPIPPHEIRNPNNPGGDANSRRRKHGRDSPRASF